MRTKDPEDVVLEDKAAVRIGGPADEIIVRIGGLEGGTVALDGGPGMPFRSGPLELRPQA